MFKLMGAKKFLHMPKGTFYIKIEDDEKSLKEVIKHFKDDPNLIANWLDIEVYGNNTGSMSFCANMEEDKDDLNDYIFYYDSNVVGDTEPAESLYLTMDEEDLPNTIPITVDQSMYLGYLEKSLVIKIKNKFLERFKELDNKLDEDNEWAYEELKSGWRKDIWVINYDSDKD